jgi:glycosyltransferase involved in cell wall biosynthesis
LAQSDLTGVPSEWGEAFGRVLIESMASGVPVVASRDGGIPEVLRPTFEDHLYPPGNVEQLQNRILQFIDWRTEKPSLGASVREHVEKNFSIDQTIDGIESVFRELQSKPMPEEV